VMAAVHTIPVSVLLRGDFLLSSDIVVARVSVSEYVPERGTASLAAVALGIFGAGIITFTSVTALDARGSCCCCVAVNRSDAVALPLLLPSGSSTEFTSSTADVSD